MIEIKIKGHERSTTVAPGEVRPEAVTLVHVAASILEAVEGIDHNEALMFVSMMAASTSEQFQRANKTVVKMPMVRKDKEGQE